MHLIHVLANYYTQLQKKRTTYMHLMLSKSLIGDNYSTDQSKV